ncbi:hypothetical protein [Candidatus Thiodictyon syntrophicum]|jgi:hypothetical protein|uniref:DUF4912 domain-containing protein n=1 Tax=Candidatus Thiodictyon syntrophicum TaxID=1166950 RepID=A0A2K8UCF7_9GAMM|nr:hypothetical protein [Candidatus Thiodictyon syntrophicum]AUB83263.1 hypothetical protein THSYN_21500 [Candidatus Thiodictyon syntrophicum]
MSTGPRAPAVEVAQPACSNEAADPDAACALPSGPEPDPGPDPTIGPAAPAAAALPPRFPGRDPGTGLVLFGVDGALCAHWRLTANDLERAGGSFPGEGGRPWPVVRLRRVRPGGGADPVDQAELGAVVRAGAGETRFQVAADHGLYHAELGLTNGDGGWLMLARSNALDNVSQVGVDLARLEAAPPRVLTAPVPPSPPPPVTPLPLAAAVTAPLVCLTTDDQEPALRPGSAVSLTGSFPLVERCAPPPWAPAPAPATTGAAPWHGPAPSVALDAAPGAVQGESAGLQLMLGLLPLAPELTLPLAPIPAARHQDGWTPPTSAPGPRQPALEGRPLRLPAPGEPAEGPDLPAAAPPGALDLGPAGPAQPAPVFMAPGWSLTYEQAPLRRTGLELEAQLRITGQAAPGTLVDLFGHPFRVGPGGRFQLVVRVDDPSLLRMALFLNPPPELTLTRDD